MEQWTLTSLAGQALCLDFQYTSPRGCLTDLMEEALPNILQMMELKLREVEVITQSHTAQSSAAKLFTCLPFSLCFF